MCLHQILLLMFYNKFLNSFASVLKCSLQSVLDAAVIERKVLSTYLYKKKLFNFFLM